MTVTSRTPLVADLVSENFGQDRGVLTIGGQRADALAEQFGTPLYIYDADLMRRRYRALSDAVGGFAEVYFSVKANPNPAVARILVEEGAGLEIASGAEFRVARAAGCTPERILFAGPGKSAAEINETLAAGLGEIHLESFEEIAMVGAVGRKLGRSIHAAIRINPETAAQGGAMRMGGKPAAFGFDEETLADVVAAVEREKTITITGMHLFAGTQILDVDVLLAQWRYGLALASRLSALIGAPLKTIDLGGGLGIPYHDKDGALNLEALKVGATKLAAEKAADPNIASARVILEPGRFLAGPAGVYLMSVRSAKMSRGARFLICDGGMHHHLAASGNLGQVIKRDYPLVLASRMDEEAIGIANVVGPLCTPLDTLGRQTSLPDAKAGDLVAVLQSGAYGLSASPVGFLSHPTPAEVLIDQGTAQLIRPATAPI